MNFTVFTQPTPKARARTVVQNGKVHSFTPRKTEKTEWEIRQAYLLRVGQAAAIHKPTPIRLHTIFYVLRPKSLPKRIAKPVARPDLDNLLKTVKDALRGYAWDDDSQVTIVFATKRFGSPPRIEIGIREDRDE